MAHLTYFAVFFAGLIATVTILHYVFTYKENQR